MLRCCEGETLLWAVLSEKPTVDVTATSVYGAYSVSFILVGIGY